MPSEFTGTVESSRTIQPALVEGGGGTVGCNGGSTKAAANVMSYNSVYYLV